MENKKTERILVINPGSTSTKIAVFDDDKQIMAQTIRHPLDEVKAFSWVMDQFDYRMEHINAALETAGIDVRYKTYPFKPAFVGGNKPRNVAVFVYVRFRSER